MNLDKVPALTLAHLENVQVVADKVCFSHSDGYLNVRIQFKTRGNFWCAYFHDLSPLKQQAVIDNLLSHIQEDGLSEDEIKRLSCLIMYMGKNKRPLDLDTEYDGLGLRLEHFNQVSFATST
ncbi:hypothetical protein HDU88_000875 [Geranomyces variabilis]|nr:hypothetical protein HDU88_000875 [Geranomyces variabilis]